jgi:putative methionine-R-sulfoxide reductase with GAF domain
MHDAGGRVFGVLDIDSHRDAHFDEIDGAGYERIVRLLEKRWNTGLSNA